MINSVSLTGRLTKVVDLKFTNNGKAVGQFNLAVDRNFKNQQGEREADFINCVIWGKGAENLANFTNKGSLIGIEGRIQTRNYDNQQGQRVYVTEVNVTNFSLLDSRNSSGSNGNNGNVNNGNADYPQNDPFVDNGYTVQDDDLPF